MSDVITRLNAALDGRYEIDREIGEGGMAIVYLARDVKHNRNVAVKVLRPELAAVVGAERFLAEIETTANLQHPHILPLFDSGEADSFLFYVMPYIDGETLADRLEREKQLPVDEAIGIATAVANALQTAHEAGVVHRDIKPGNILMSQGEPLVSDFGIALAVGAAGGNRLTETGLSVGTPYYMSPEQATGDQAIGPASDTYALACVLYEMLVGEPPYTGNTAQAVLGKIIMGEAVSATAVRSSIPSNVDAAIRKALEKLPADRFTGAHGFARALGDSGFRHGAVESEEVEIAQAGPWNPVSLGLAAVALVAVIAAAVGWTRPEPPVDPVVRAVVDLHGLEVRNVDDVAISPDGSALAFVGIPEGEGKALYVRNSDEASFRLIPGTDGVDWPVFSPDGQWIAFEGADGGLFKVSVAGGAPRPVVSPPGLVVRPDWGDDETIVFEGGFDGVQGIFRVADTGGEPVLLVERSRGNLVNPRLLPGGTKLLATESASAGTVLLDIESDSLYEVMPNAIDAQFAETGHLLYSDLAGGLWAAPFDVEEGAITGEASPVFDGLTVWFGRWARFSVSDNGTIVYGSGGGGAGNIGGEQQLLLVGMDGVEDVRPLTPRFFNQFRWSPDGSSVVYNDGDQQSNIYTYNVTLGTTPKQLTFEGDNAYAVWSPDGTRVAFSAIRDGTDGADIFVKSVTEDTPPERILSLPGNQDVEQWPAEDVLVFSSRDGGANDLWLMDPADSASARPYLESEADLVEMAVSPDGSLAAYTSDESGTDQVYVRSFPDPQQPVRVSLDEGELARWSPTGDTIYYWKGGVPDTLFAAAVEREPTFSVLSREPLFSSIYSQAGADLHPDGARWVIPQRVRAARPQGTEDASVEPEQFFIVTNWFTELRAALGEDDR